MDTIRTFWLIIIFFLHFSLINAQNENFSGYVSPVKIPLLLSGTYGELRNSHFHAGIDIKTDGKTGVRVYSIDEGYVSRIKVSPYGYGKTIYIDHPDGHTSVYGHLEKFSYSIDSVARNKQYELQQYSIDYYPKPGTIRIKKEEYIGNSGNTGFSQGPHLHFEIRDTKSEIPVNPLNYLYIKDTIAPVFKSVYLYSLSDTSESYEIFRKKYIPDEKKTDTLIVETSGIFALGLDVQDKINESESSCGIFSIELFNDAHCIHSIFLDSIPFSESRYIKSHSDYRLKSETREDIYKLYREPNDKLNICKTSVNNGFLKSELNKDIILKCRVCDFSKNCSDMIIVAKGKEILNVSGRITDSDTHYAEYDKVFKYSDTLVKMKIPSYTLVKNEYLKIKKDSTIKLNSCSDVFFIGDYGIPLLEEIEISMKVKNTDIEESDKLLIVSISPKGSFLNQGGSYEKGFINAKIKNTGRYTVMIDTISPIIKPLNIFDGAKFKKDPSIRLKVTDNLSGVSSFNGYIDGKWVLFEYEPKNAEFEYTFDHHVERNGEIHQLKFEVADDRKNLSTFQCDFYY